MRINLPDNNEQKQDKIARLFLQVSKFEADKSGNEYAVGTDLTGQIPGELKIRLTTVEERMTDRPKEKKKKFFLLHSHILNYSNKLTKHAQRHTSKQSLKMLT
jgi:hypothetical protein